MPGFCSDLDVLAVKCKKQRDTDSLDIKLQHAAFQALEAIGRVLIQVQKAVDGGFQHGCQDSRQRCFVFSHGQA